MKVLIYCYESLRGYRSEAAWTELPLFTQCRMIFFHDV